MRIYDDIPEEVRDLVQKMVEADGAASIDIGDQLEELIPDPQDRIDALVKLKLEAEADAEVFKAQVTRFTEKKRSSERRVEAIEHYAENLMRANSVRRMEGKLFKIWLQKNGAKSIQWLGLPHQIPEGFRHVEITLDRTAAQEAYRRGELPEGFEVYQGEHPRMA